LSTLPVINRLASDRDNNILGCIKAWRTQCDFSRPIKIV
jgi:hypothetical protein